MEPNRFGGRMNRQKMTHNQTWNASLGRRTQKLGSASAGLRTVGVRWIGAELVYIFQHRDKA
jgi:hypothetical protein